MRDPMASIRAEVMAQPSPERLEYALELLEWYLNPVPAFYATAADLGLRLCAADLRVLYALDRELGNFVSAERLMAARCFDRTLDEWQTLERIPQTVRRIRQEAERLGLRLEITQQREIGYRMTTPTGLAILGGAPEKVAA